MATALMPGSYDPIHLGHLEMVASAAKVFDHVVVAAVGNPDKGSGVFDLAEREQLIAESVTHLPNVTAIRWSGLLVDLAREVGADVMVKGLRGVADFEYEVQMAHMNRSLDRLIDTVFIPTSQEFSHISSSIVRDIAKVGGDVGRLVPPSVLKKVTEKFSE